MLRGFKLNLAKVLPIFFSLLVFFAVWGDNASAQYWVDDPANCPVSYNGQNCAPNLVCGIDGSAAQCYDTASLNEPVATVQSNTRYTAGFGAGYVLNCYALDSVTDPYCDNNGNWWCNRDETCYTNHRWTECSGTTASCGSCHAGYADCTGDTACEVQTGVTSCVGGHGTLNAGCTCTCSFGYFNCDADPATCDGGGYANHMYYTNCSDTACDAGYGDCNMDGFSGNGCEVQFNVTASSTEPNAHFGANCDATVCNANYLDCNGDLGDGGNGCEILDGGVCYVGSLPGTYDACNGCVVNKSYFETGTLTEYMSDDPLLWGYQYGSGPLMQFTSYNASTTGGVFYVGNDGKVGIGTSTPSAMLTVGMDAGNQFLVNNSGVILDGTWQGSPIGAMYGGTGFSTWANGDMLYANGVNSLDQLGIGSVGEILTVGVSGLPDWLSTSSLNIDIQNMTGVLDTEHGGTGKDLHTATGFLYFANGTSTASTTIHIGNTDLSATGLLSLSSNVLSLNSGGNWTGTLDGLDGSQIFTLGAWFGTSTAPHISVLENLSTVGTIANGTWHGDVIDIAYGGTGTTSLSNLITLGAHTTGAYVSTISDAGSSTIVVHNSGGENAAITLDLAYNSIGTNEIKVGSAGTSGWVLSSNGDGTFYWRDPSGVGVTMTQEEVEDYAGALIASSSGTHTRISVAYDDSLGAINLVVDDNLNNYSWANIGTSHLTSARGGTGWNSSGQTGFAYVNGGSWGASNTISAINLDSLVMLVGEDISSLNNNANYTTVAGALAGLSSIATGLSYNSGTGAFSFTSGYEIPLSASTTQWDSAFVNMITAVSGPLHTNSGNLSIDMASSTANGYLASSDWVIFNNKWDGLSDMGLSQGHLYVGDGFDHPIATSSIYIDPSGNFGVGTTTVLAKLDVYGNLIISGLDRYVNFGSISGMSGYGIRDDGGVIKVKNLGGEWTQIGAGAVAFNDLNDVDTTGVNFGNLIYYNGSSWEDVATSSLNIDLINTTGTLSVNRGGTGLNSTPAYGQILLGNGSGYTLVATSTLGLAGLTNSGTAGSIPYFNQTGQNLTATSVIYIDTATGFIGMATTTPGKRLTVNGSGQFSELCFEGGSCISNWAAAGGIDGTGVAGLPVVWTDGNSLEASSTLQANVGGTGKSSWTPLAIPYLAGTTTFSEINIGSANYLLAVNATQDGYEWVEASSTGASQEQIQDHVGGMVVGNTETLITVEYDDLNGKLNFAVNNDLHNYSWANVTATDLHVGSLTQGWSSTLDSIIGISSTTDGLFMVGSPAGWVGENGSTARTSLGLGSGDTVTFTGLTINGETITDLSGTGINVSGGAIVSTLGTSVDLGTEINGTLAVNNGGTGASSLNNLITLSTHTTGAYVATISDAGSSTIVVNNSGGENAAITLDLAYDSVGANEIKVAGNGTSGWILASNGDGTFYWRDPSTAGVTMTQEEVEDYAGALIASSSGVHSLITITYNSTNDASGTIDFVVENDLSNYSWASVDGFDLHTGSITQAWDNDLDDLAALTASNNYFIMGNGTDWTSVGSSSVRSALNINSIYDYGVNTAGTAGQVWVSQGAGSRGQWTATTSLGLLTVAQIGVDLNNNYISKWNGASFVNSLIFDDGTNVGIGTTTPVYDLSVVGTSSFDAICLGGSCVNDWGEAGSLNGGGNTGYVAYWSGPTTLSSESYLSISRGGTGSSTPSGLLYGDGAGNILSVANNSANWNTAYSWGNHAGLYDVLGQSTSTLSIHTSLYNHGNYDTAFAWGNHAAAGYLLQAFASTTYLQLADYFASTTPNHIVGLPNLSSVGTLTGGTWNANTITVAYGGTGSTTLSGLLKGNGTGAIQTAIAGTDYISSLSDLILPMGYVYAGDSSNHPVATSSLFIDPAGNIGVGTTSPLQKLTIQTATGIDPFQIASSTGAPLFYVNQVGNVGMGTNNPLAKLHLDSDDVTKLRIESSWNPGIDFYDDEVFEGRIETNSNSMYVLSTTGDLYLGSAAGTVMTLDSAGRYVGINDDNPDFGLEVAASSSLGYFGISGGVAGSGNGDLFIVDGNGNVGIGTSTPSYLLDVYGSDDRYLASIYNTAITGNAGGLFVRSDGDGALLNLNYKGTDVLTITGAQTVFNNPVSFGSVGDVAIANDLIMTNGTAGNINFDGPGYIRTDSSWQNLDLTLTAANLGDVVIDDSLVVTGTTSIANLLYVNAFTGRIGVGTSSPLQTFALQGTAGTNPFTIASSTGATLFQLDQSGNITSANWNGGVIGISYGGTGTSTAPSSGYMLIGNGSGGYEFIASSTFYDGTVNSGLSGQVAFYNSNGTIVSGTSTLFMVDGNVGIGTTNPSAKLTIASSDSGLTTEVFQINNSNGVSMFNVYGSGAIDIGGVSSTSPKNRLTVYSGGEQQLQLLNTGNFQIGSPYASTSKGYDFAVNGSTGLYGSLNFGADGSRISYLSSDGSLASTVKISDGLNGGPSLDDSDSFGTAVVNIGDLDGDGVTDLAIGAGSDENTGTDEGAVYIAYMNSSGSVKNTVKISDGLNGGPSLDDGDGFGSSITNIGDLDGDGVTDLVIGAGADENTGTDEGAIYITYLNSNGTAKNTVKISDGLNGGPGLDDNDYFGFSLANIGDLDGDGVTDLAVGAMYDQDAGLLKGSVYIIYLNSDGTAKNTVKISDGLNGGPILDNDAFGSSIANIGDLDGDGVTDLAIGAMADEGTGNGEGAVYITYMNTNGTVKNTVKISDGLNGGPILDNTDLFGRSLANIGDLNGDGIVDLAIGANQDEGTGSDEGAIYITYLNSNGTAKNTVKISDGLNGGPSLDDSDYFGTSIASVGDLNGDDIVDLAIGAMTDEGAGSDEGAIYIAYMNNNSRLRFATNDIDRLTILDNGNVGIGTSSPYAKLTAWGSGVGTDQLVNFVNGASTSLFTVLENGNVGIGVVNPTQKLSVLNGVVSANLGYGNGGNYEAVRGSASNGGGYSYGIHGVTGSNSSANVYGVVASLVNTNGTALMVESDTVTSGRMLYLNQINSSFANDMLLADMANGSGSFTGNFFNLRNNGIGRFKVTNDGTTAIGTSSASAKLTVWGGGIGSNSLVNFVNSASTSLFMVLENGNIGIGTTTPTAKLTIASSDSGLNTKVFQINNSDGVSMLNVYGSGAIDIGGVSSTSPKNRLTVYSGGEQQLQLLNTGNLQIGSPYASTSKGYDFAVNGSTGLYGSLNFGADGSRISYLSSDGSLSSTVKISDGLNGGPSLDDDDYFGSAIANIGDLNGDGITDLAIGAMVDENAGTDEGAIYIAYMNSNGSVQSTVKISDGLNGGPVLDDNDYFGSSIANIGDLNGDGIADLAIGAMYDENAGTDEGAIYIAYMNINGSIQSTVKISDGLNGGPVLDDNDYFGSAIANIGDLNGDGITDLAIGAIFDENAGTNEGAIYIAYMNSNGSVQNTVKISDGLNGGPSLGDSDRFGSAIANIGDFNGDGVTDLAIGAYADENAGSGEGAIFITYMNSNGSVQSTVKISDGLNGGPSLDDWDNFGSSIANIGDLNGDGITDLAIGAMVDEGTGSEEGAVYIAYMNSNGSIQNTVKISDGFNGGPSLNNSDDFGSAIANIGDFNGDGIIDLAIGADWDENIGLDEGAIYIAYMNNNSRLRFATDDIDRLTILDNGNVGIGTSSPYAKLTAWGNGVGTDQLVNFVNAASTSLFTVLENGNVGIGTTNPAYPFVVNGGGGTAFFDTFGSLIIPSAQKLEFGPGSGEQILGDATNNVVQILSNDSVVATFGSNGVGIGTTTPISELSVYGDLLLDGANRYINFGTSTLVGSSGYGIRDNNGQMEFKNASGNWVAIGSAGSMGSLGSLSDITITDPQLGDVLGFDGSEWINVASSTYLRESNFSGTGLMVRTANNQYTTRTTTGTSNEIIVMNGDGLSGNPTISLPDVVYLGSAGQIGRDADNLIDFSVDNQITFRTNSNNNLVINSSGYLGIGTSTPSYKLDVYGSGSLLRVGSANGDAFTVSDTQIVSNVPHIFSGVGDVDIANNLYFSNISQSEIGSYGPLYLVAGDTGTNNNLYLSGRGTGGVYIDDILNVSGTTTIADLLYVNKNGMIGMGTSTPAARLHVYIPYSASTTDGLIIESKTTATSTPSNGLFVVRSDVNVNGNNVFKIDAGGNYTYDGTGSSPAADYAEYFYTTDTDLQPGEAVCVDVTRANAVERCRNSADNNVMGIISTQPAILGNAKPQFENDDNYVIVAMLGQIPALVSTENGEIRPGDSLTPASKPGYVMRAVAGDPTVGVALQSFGSISFAIGSTSPESEIEKGTINVLISRRNKSLTVETVEEQITSRIAAMEIEDEVRILISSAVANLDLSEDIIALVKAQLDQFEAKLTVEFNSLNQKIENTSGNINDVLARLGSIESDIDDFDRRLRSLEHQSPVQSETLGLTITAEGNIILSPVATNISSSTASSTDVAVVEIETLEETEKTAFVVNQKGEADVADFRYDGVSIVNIAETGKVTVIGEMLVDGRIMVCSGGVCGDDLNSLVDETMGDMGVEGRVVAGAFENICSEGMVWVPGSAKYGTMPGFCADEREVRLADDVSFAQVNVAQGEAQLACLNRGNGYHLIGENEWLTIAENIIRVGANDADSVMDGLQLATSSADATGMASGTSFVLSNGNQIYGLAGGVAEWTDQIITGAEIPEQATSTWQEYYAIENYRGLNIAPPYYYSSANGIGMIKTGVASTGRRGFVRGETAIYDLDLSRSPIEASAGIGFRCAK